MRLKALRQQRADLVAEAKGIYAAAGKDNNRGLTDAEKARDDAIQVELEALEADIKREERQIERERAVAVGQATPTGRVEVGVDHATERPWTSFGEYMQAIAFASFPGAVPDPRLFAASGASAGAGTDGGFLVRADWTDALLNKTMGAAVLAPRCWSIPIGEGSDGLEAPYVNETSRATGSRWGGVQVYRSAETTAVTGGKPTFGKFELRLDDLKGLFYASQRLLRDATALEAIAMKAFSSEFAFKLDDEIIRGDGAGQCLGVLNSPALVTVAKENGQTSATVKSENVMKMFARMLASRIFNSAWFINQELLPQLFQMYVAIGTSGQLVYMPPTGLASAPFGTLLGRPVFPIEQCSGLGTLGDILFLSLPEDYVLISKPMVAASSMHVRFIYDEMTYKWTYPIIGRPILQAAITPYKATTATTLSPFVALAAR